MDLIAQWAPMINIIQINNIQLLTNKNLQHLI